MENKGEQGKHWQKHDASVEAAAVGKKIHLTLNNEEIKPEAQPFLNWSDSQSVENQKF